MTHLPKRNFIVLNGVNDTNPLDKHIATQFTNRDLSKPYAPKREFQDARINFPKETVQLGPNLTKHIYDRKGGYAHIQMTRPKGSMYDIDLSGYRNGHINDGQSKTYGFLAYPYHSYNINEHVTIKNPIQIEFKQYTDNSMSDMVRTNDDR